MGEGLRVCHVVFSLALGGLERVVLNLVSEGRRLGQEVSVVCVLERGVLAGQVEGLGAEVRCIGKPPGIKFSAIRDLRGVFEELRPDVVHSHQIGVLFYAGPAARRAGVPVVVHTEHGKHFQRMKTRVLGRWAGRYAERFFAVSEDIARDVVARRVVPGRKVVVVPNGIDTRAFAESSAREAVRGEMGIPLDARVIGTVGRLNEVKRQDVMIEAFAKVRERLADARLLLVGEGPARGELEALVKRLGVEESVHFAGYQDAPQRFYGAMDVFTLTSRSEGMPLSVLEAWAAGVPVVASRVGGLPEMVREGETGMLVEAGDVAGFARAYEKVLSDGEYAEKIRRVSREYVVSRFDTAAMTADYARHYEELLAAKGGRAVAVAANGGR